MASEKFKWWNSPATTNDGEKHDKISLEDFCLQNIESGDKLIQMEEEPEIRCIKPQKFF